jgi:hypothetical protein
MQAIINYLEHLQPDYKIGVELLSAVSKNRQLLNLLRGKHNEQTERKLRFELARFAGRPDLVDLPVAELVAEDPTAPTTPAELASTTPAAPASITDQLASVAPDARPQLEQITQRQGAIFNRQAVLSNQLAGAASDADRKVLVAEQETLEAENNHLAEQKAILLAGGTLAPAEASADQEVAELDAAQLKARQLVLRPKLSKAKKALNLAKSNEKKLELSTSIVTYQAELNQIDLRLKALAGPKD